jgi:glycosyltransferase involved in cell wall biosynthesis
MIKHKDIYFYAHHTFEPWDYTNPVIQGIGGSETSQIEMASRLANRHHNVVSYAPVGWTDEYKIHRNVKWMSYEKATFKEPGIWVIYRCPEILETFPIKHPKQEIYFVAQDTFYETMTEKLARRIDKYICLCTDHANYVATKHPYLKDKIVISSNGINIDMINEAEALNLPRNPHRLIYTSSPDRGLEQLIPIFKKAKEFIPNLELHIFYGFDNIDKVIQRNPFVGKMKDKIMKGMEGVDGIFWHGRVGQIELTAEWMKSGIWCYPINFTETSCISCMEAQACNVIPVTSPKWALRENVTHGILIDGDVKDKLTLCRFVGEIIRICNSTKLQDKLKNGMSIEAKVRFNWERFVDQWESWFYNFKECEFFNTQYAFQWKYKYGVTLNVGCDKDSSNLGALDNVVNLDLKQNERNNVDIIADFRYYTDYKKAYNTVILGDVLEHMTYGDAVAMLIKAKHFIDKATGQIVITCPSDSRTHEQQRIHAGTLDENGMYTDNVSFYHRYISQDELAHMLKDAGLSAVIVQEIDYTHFKGFGLVCKIDNGE